MITVGILSDTHLPTADSDFAKQCARIFADCDTILHAGDLTDISVLSVFQGKEVHAVCGNMCNNSARHALPEKKRIILGGYTIGLTHGAGPRHNIEDRVFSMFSDASCIVYGHSHQPVCHTFGKTLLINPGSFIGTGRHGAPGTYAVLKISDDGLDGSIYNVSCEL